MIYFIQCGENGPIKIGQSDNPERRLEDMQTGCPYELKLLWVCGGNGHSESSLHERFAHERIRGEWFRPSESIISFADDKLRNYSRLTLFSKDAGHVPAVVMSEGINGEVKLNFNNLAWLTYDVRLGKLTDKSEWL